MAEKSTDYVETFSRSSEPTIEGKWKAKKAAWRTGLPPQTSHRIHLCDSREMTRVAQEEVHLVVTSPPYFNLIDYEGEYADWQLGHFQDYQGFLDELDRVWRQCFELLVPGGRMCIVVGDVCLSRREAGRHHVLPLHADIAVRCRTIGFDYLTPILWSKIANAATEVGGENRFLGKPYEPNGIIKNDIEYVLLLRKPGGYRKPTPTQRALSILDSDQHKEGYRSIWTDIPGENRKRGHPAPFPEELAYRLINLFSFVGDTVLDPFWGTGTTTAAAIRAIRSSIGFDVEPKYIELGKSRLLQCDAMVPAQIEFPE